jgi:glutathione-regulated potassium-efflux system ancillary protein KefC/glutathione-regulated potassium-efflux system protein KefB
MWGQEEAYILASRDAAKTTERLLAADLARMNPTEQEGWDTTGRDEDTFEEAGREEGR